MTGKDGTRKATGGVLLDFDGTLTKSAFDWPAMKAEMGLPDGTVSILDYLRDAPPKAARRAAAILERHETAAAARAEANEGAHALVRFLGEKGVPFGIATNNALRHVRPMLARIGLAVDALVTRDIGWWKPDPRHVRAAAEAIGVAPEACVLIGDGRFDMMAAREAGMTAVHLSPVPGPACDHRVARLPEAIPLLARLLAREGR